MTEPEPAEEAMRSISDVERDTGVAKETLRVWERRYAFPQPGRDASGERIYPAAQVDRLRLVKRLLDQGYRPGKIMHLSNSALGELGGRISAPPSFDRDDPALQACLALLKAHRLHELRQRLAQAQLEQGLHSFVTGLIAPLTTLVGDAWAAGTVAVFEEHLYAEAVQAVLRQAIDALGARGAPRIVLTTVPQERHGLGLLMAEALFALEGAHCVSLGVQTPLAEIVQAARSQQADVVALSFSSVMSPRTAVDNVNELQNRLGAATLVWAGGSCAMLARRQLGPDCVVDLAAIPAAVARWRAEHPAARP
jgi:DNA-binding transcriptional MerR regulator